jgi:hypothetical protein
VDGGTVLELNGYDVVFGDDDAFDLVMAASQSRQDVDALARNEDISAQKGRNRRFGPRLATISSFRDGDMGSWSP